MNTFEGGENLMSSDELGELTTPSNGYQPERVGEAARGSGDPARRHGQKTPARQLRENGVDTLAPTTARCKIRFLGLLRDGPRRSWTVPNVPRPRQTRNKYGGSKGEVMGGDGWVMDITVLDRRPLAGGDLGARDSDPFPGAVYLSVDREPRSPVRKGVRESSGVSRIKQDASEMRPDVPFATLAPRGIFRVPHWASFDASVMNSATVPAIVASGPVVCLLFRLPSRALLVDPAVLLLFMILCPHIRLRFSDLELCPKLWSEVLCWSRWTKMGC
ncbi:hypothetical protein CRG98_013746 [Punica granatum]|uniref:Uncharacterized protein n=1 Tax=Punica granatum TaxID=22663 RepID=A0A2I0KBF7_PUNGR|nr:hypothetical protein CRG98_013746 [Punica granatum]